MTRFPIDVVLTWVDGDDPAHREKMRRYAPDSAFREDDVAGATRFRSVGEIYWCVRSIRKFAPFVRRIFIVTDGQDPQIPEGKIPVEIVDHRTIFRGYGERLPVFNSIAIESMTWRIPGLSEHYVEMNDDFMLCAPLRPCDFYADEATPVCYAEKHSLLFDRFTRALKPKVNGRRKVTFKGVMLNGASLAGSRWIYYRMNHAPRPLLRSFFESYFAGHPEALERNISCRFRSAGQFSSEELFYVSKFRECSAVLKPFADVLFYLEPKDKRNYIPRKLAMLERGSYKFCCFNSIDKAGDEDLALIRSHIDRILA